MNKEIQKRESVTEPWSEIDRAFEEIRQRFQDVWGLQPFGTAFFPVGPSPGASFRPARTDVRDTGKAYRIVAEIPGLPKDKLDIRVRGTSVEIRGEHSEQKEESGTEVVHRERSYAGFYRSLELPEPVVATEAKAKVENGLLELELPKEHPRPSSGEVKIAVE